MQRSARDEAMRWLRQAERDMDDARFTLGGDRYSLTCFVAQQAAEKALKSFLYAAGEEDVWGHSVAELSAAVAKLEPSLVPLALQAAPLDKYYIPTRYPNGLPGGIPADAFSRSDAEAAIAMADLVLAAVRRLVNER